MGLEPARMPTPLAIIIAVPPTLCWTAATIPARSSRLAAPGRSAQTIALSHHERWDGTGYPAGLSGEDIPLVGRICAVVDVYDALLSKRPYKEAWLVQDALAEIQRNRGAHFDPHLVDAFLEFAPSLDEELQSSFMRESTIAARRPAFV